MLLSSMQISETGERTDWTLFRHRHLSLLLCVHGCVHVCVHVCEQERGRYKDIVSLRAGGVFGGSSRERERRERQKPHKGDRE